MREQQQLRRSAPTTGTVAYVLKGYPRLSEIFIASEIYRLEQQGIPLRLFVIKPADEKVRHPVVDRIRAVPEYLPDAGSVSDIPLYRWLATYGSVFFPALLRTLVQHPTGVMRVAAFAFAQALRARRTFWAWPRKIYLKEFFQAVALADRLLQTPEVQHLHAHFAHGATTVTWLAAMITGLPFSFTAHAKDIYSESLNPAGLLQRKLQAARFAVTCTEANRLHLQQVAPGAKIVRVYHGVNADFARLLAQSPLLRQQSSAEPLRILGVGRLVAKKGFDVLIEACGLLQQQQIAFTVTLAGEEGEHSNVIRQRVASLGLTDCIRFTGPLRQDQLFAEYRRATVFCLPCRVLDDGDRDGIPNVLMEAMACGLPVVTTAISGIPELVTDGINGVLIPPEDPVALAAAIMRLSRDSQLVGRLAAAAQVTVRDHFDGDWLAGQLAALFQYPVDVHSTPRPEDGHGMTESPEPLTSSLIQR